MARTGRPLHFVYSALHRSTGSTVMRGVQLARLAESVMPDRTVALSPLGEFLRGSDVFLTKGAVKRMTMPILESLRANDNVLFADLVDEVAPPFVGEYVDVIVASSITAFVDLQREFPRKRVELVNHHVDPRIDQIVRGPSGSADVAYFGEPANAFMSPAIAARVSLVPVDTSSSSGDWLARLGSSNVHYAVRAKRDLDHHKPFLKGFTAAHVGAAVVAASSEPEAIHWLGREYPFFVSGEPSELSIIAALDHVEQAFGSAEWADALQIMSDVRERTAARRIADELRRALHD